MRAGLLTQISPLNSSISEVFRDVKGNEKAIFFLRLYILIGYINKIILQKTSKKMVSPYKTQNEALAPLRAGGESQRLSALLPQGGGLPTTIPPPIKQTA